MAESVRIKGIQDEKNRLDKILVTGKHSEIKRIGMLVSEDLLKKARDNAPVREGELIDSMSPEVRDRGAGRGITIIVSAGNKIYANRMHEAHYQARPKSDMVRRISKRTGKAYWTYRKSMKIMGKRTRRSGGVKVTQEYAIHASGGFWIDSAGNKHGRKYLTRALKDNYQRYIKAFAVLGDR